MPSSSSLGAFLLGKMEGLRLFFLDGYVWLKVDVSICLDLKLCYNNRI